MAKEFKCENCGGNLKTDSEHRMQFCPYCGAAVKIPETAFDHEKFVLEHQEKVRQQKVKEDRKGTFIIIGVLALVFIMLIIYNTISDNEQKAKYANADQQIAKVQELISTGEYDQALIEAESIRVSKEGLLDWDYNKYESARKDLIKLIKEKQKERP